LYNGKCQALPQQLGQAIGKRKIFDLAVAASVREARTEFARRLLQSDTNFGYVALVAPH
jgi:hypothetical protein